MSETPAGEREDLTVSTRIVEMLASAAGAGLGYATTGSPEGTMAGAVLAPAAALAWDIDRAARARRLQRAATALIVSAEESGVGIEDLEERSRRDPETAELLARVIQVAADARMAEKVSALGRLLGRTVINQVKFDEAFLLAAALEDLEAPHVRLLALVNGARETEWYSSGLGRVGSLEHFAGAAGGSLVLPALAAALVRHGLIEMAEGAAGLNRRLQLIAAMEAFDSGPPVKDQWATTGLGHRCLTLVLPDPPPWAIPVPRQPILES